MHPAEPTPRACPNCGREGADHFCANCGQELGELFPTVDAWIREALGELFTLEGKLLPSLRALAWPPGDLTVAWYQGRRTRFVSPLRLYLAAAVIFVLAWPHTPVFAQLRDFASGFYSGGNGPSGPPSPAAVEFGTRRVLDALPAMFIIVFVPVFALSLQIVARGPGRYIGHLVTALHFHTVFFIAASLTAPVHLFLGETWQDLERAVLGLVLFPFLTASLARVYGCTWWQALMRASVVCIVYLALLGGLIPLLSIVFEIA